MKAFFPNAITSLNLFFGLIGIVAALNGSLGIAGICIIISAVLDFFDGFVARALGVSGEFGKQLDSLSDMMSFGALPGFIAFGLLDLDLPSYSGGHLFDKPIILLLPFLIPIFSALRLAKFNIDPEQGDQFIGVPTPANAFFWAGIAIIFTYDRGSFITESWMVSSTGLAILILLCSGLLVAPVAMVALKFKNYDLKDNIIRYIFIVGVIVIIFASIVLFSIGYALVFSFIWYVLFSLFSSLLFKQKV